MHAIIMSVTTSHGCITIMLQLYLINQSVLHYVSKNAPNVIDCNLKTDYQILIIFGVNIPDTTGYPTTVELSASLNMCFCTIECRINANRGPWQLFARGPLLTIRDISRISMFPISIRPIFIFLLLQNLCRITWLLTGWKKFSTSGGPEARGICHICHMVNPALALSGENRTHVFSRLCRSRHLLRRKLEWSFDGQLCLKYSYQKLLKSDNPSSSYKW